jgi:hypothetical protein
MKNLFWASASVALFWFGAAAPLAFGQETPPPGAPPRGERPGPPDFIGPGPGGPPPGFGRPGGPMMQERKLVPQFDKDSDGRLNTEERAAGREFIRKERAEGRGPGRGPRRFGGNENQEPPQPGPKLSPADVKSFPDAPLYDTNVLRTFFLEFEKSDWEKELADFYSTDVEVPAKLTVDGKTYPDVGVHFRGASSYFTVAEGRKRSLNLSMDFAREDQRLYGYRTLNLLNSHRDPTFLRSVLYFHVARQYLPAPQANYVQLAINGESWGVYVNAQQFNKDFIKDWFGTTKGARWKAPGSPRGNAGLADLGEDPAEYKRRYEIKSKDEPKAWADLIKLCRTLGNTPPADLEDALAPMLNIDRVLWFLALENVFINSDGYWIRSSDYNLYQDIHGRFHLVPHDSNETFNRPEGPGGGGRVSGIELDPLHGSDDPGKPLLSRLLAAPHLKARYLHHVRTIAQEWLDWDKLDPLAKQFQALIAEAVNADTRKLSSFDAFYRGAAEDIEEETFRGPRRGLSLKSFVEQRRQYLLARPELKKPAPAIASVSSGEKGPGSVEFTARISGAVAPEVVLFYFATEKEAPFKALPMTKGKEGYWSVTLSRPNGAAELLYYVEARSAIEGTAAFWPARAEFGAARYALAK